MAQRCGDLVSFPGRANLPVGQRILHGFGVVRHPSPFATSDISNAATDRQPDSVD